VHYFPSYEIVQNSDRSLTWEEDMRHVKGEVVRHIMSLFLHNYFSGLPVTSSKLYASPNPVPPGIGPGKTTISWSSHATPDAAIYVSGGGIEEALFAGGSYGSKEASFIETGATYEFSLYTGRNRNRRVAQLSVTRPPVDSITS